MSRWLCIEALFLTGRYHGRSDDGRTAEWPPNPHRLFQALVAAANLGFRRAENMAAKRAALHWLEARNPPEMIAPPATALNILRLYVPNNDMDRSTLVLASRTAKPPAELRTGKDLHPSQLSGDGTVRFLWPIADSEWEVARQHSELLCAEARHLHCLGFGIDLVAGDGRVLTDSEKAALPGTVYLADTAGVGWRVPMAGSLEELTARHADLTKRVVVGSASAQRYVAPPAPPRQWREVAYLRRRLGRERVVHGFLLVNEEGETRSFDPRRTIEVAAWLRHAAHLAARHLKLDESFVEGFVCGHGEKIDGKNSRFSYLPLPTIAPKGRDGRIRRVLIAEPLVSGGHQALGVIRRLNGMPLVAEGTGEVMAELNAAPYHDDGVFWRYLPAGGAKHWGTVTPIVLPGRDDHRSRKAIGLVLKALAQAGYTTPVAEVTLQTAPVFAGQELAARYRVPEYLKAYPRSHAIISFSEKVPGPVCLGSGRHAGLGVLAQIY